MTASFKQHQSFMSPYPLRTLDSGTFVLVEHEPVDHLPSRPNRRSLTFHLPEKPKKKQFHDVSLIKPTQFVYLCAQIMWPKL